uniref:Uncharacterized protein n=1 Tax=Pipistrellus kuhlii TaxID=59472 RepID=A0A7J7TQ76_PIPKU|nr:hypothetical protein mPipKuh1_009302 [Pipistrellus kuhlii]
MHFPTRRWWGTGRSKLGRSPRGRGRALGDAEDSGPAAAIGAHAVPCCGVTLPDRALGCLRGPAARCPRGGGRGEAAPGAGLAAADRSLRLAFPWEPPCPRVPCALAPRQVKDIPRVTKCQGVTLKLVLAGTVA